MASDETTATDTQKPIHSSVPKQNLTAHFSKKHRAGKIATIIKDFQCSNTHIEALARTIKKNLGVGGSVKNKEIIIQGDFRTKIIEILTKLGHRVKKVGG